MSWFYYVLNLINSILNINKYKNNYKFINNIINKKQLRSIYVNYIIIS